MNPLQYTGEQWHETTGLLYLRARWYDPQVGRFLTQDPFPGLPTQPQTLNPYPYTLNNPVNLTDPSGEFADALLDAVFIAVDVGLIVWDSYQLVSANPCEKEMWREQLQRDSTALALDSVCLFLPFVTGGGRGWQLAYAGSGHLIASGAIRMPRAARVAQAGAKVAQATGKLAWFAQRGSHKGRPRSNVAQNKQFRGAVQQIERVLGRKLERDEIQQLHRSMKYLSDPGFWDIVEEGLNLFGG